MPADHEVAIVLDGDACEDVLPRRRAREQEGADATCSPSAPGNAQPCGRPIHLDELRDGPVVAHVLVGLSRVGPISPGAAVRPAEGPRRGGRKVHLAAEAPARGRILPDVVAGVVARADERAGVGKEVSRDIPHAVLELRGDESLAHVTGRSIVSASDPAPGDADPLCDAVRRIRGRDVEPGREPRGRMCVVVRLPLRHALLGTRSRRARDLHDPEVLDGWRTACDRVHADRGREDGVRHRATTEAERAFSLRAREREERDAEKKRPVPELCSGSCAPHRCAVWMRGAECSRIRYLSKMIKSVKITSPMRSSRSQSKTRYGSRHAKVKHLSVREVRSLFRAIPPANLRDQVLFHLIYRYALRRTEACLIQLDDFAPFGSVPAVVVFGPASFARGFDRSFGVLGTSRPRTESTMRRLSSSILISTRMQRSRSAAD